MDLKVLEHNAMVLYKHSEGNFNVDEQGCLQQISGWNFFGRFVKWLNADEVNAKVQNVVKETLSEMHKFNNEALQYNENAVKNNSQGRKDLFYVHYCTSDDSWFDISGDGFYISASAIAKTVLESKQFGEDPEIQTDSQKLVNQLDSYYKKTAILHSPGWGCYVDETDYFPPSSPTGNVRNPLPASGWGRSGYGESYYLGTREGIA